MPPAGLQNEVKRLCVHACMRAYDWSALVHDRVSRFANNVFRHSTSTEFASQSLSSFGIEGSGAQETPRFKQTEVEAEAAAARASVSIRQHPSASVSIRQHPSEAEAEAEAEASRSYPGRQGTPPTADISNTERKIKPIRVNIASRKPADIKAVCATFFPFLHIQFSGGRSGGGGGGTMMLVSTNKDWFAKWRALVASRRAAAALPAYADVC
jgi:hypothetical protein